jgi:hypothetical protein
MRLKRDEVPEYRTKLLEEQQGICPLCEKRIKLRDQALDHDHSTGHCRATLHSSCNVLLGKIENFISRHGKSLNEDDRLDRFCSNVCSYMAADYSDNTLHWTHRTDTERQILKYKRLQRRSKKPETKAKYKQLIKELRDG